MDKTRTFSPTVITSRKAKKDFERIKARHSDILSNLQNHQVKVKAYKDQKETERKANLQALIENRKAKMEQEAQAKQENQKQITDQQTQKQTQEMQHQKELRDHQVKMAELEIKRKALEQP